MYLNDHEPPHFHAQHDELKAKVRIDTLEVIDSSLTTRYPLGFSVGRAAPDRASRQLEPETL